MMIARGLDSDATKSFERVARDEVALVAVLVDQVVGARAAAVVQGHGVAVVGEVAGEVSAHDRESGDSDVGECPGACVVQLP